jgi:TolB-like protein
MPSLLPGYEYDIFISYRQKDNKGDKWVSEFVEALKTELEATFKEEISVYFDINPSDYLLESYDVDASLKDKLKCLVFIPIISRTYCDSRSFAWEHEFKAFVEQASQDKFGLKVKLPGGNVASRVLPIQIHEIAAEDKTNIEKELGGILRPIEFIYKEPGVNRPLRGNEDHPDNNLNKTFYRNQTNKVANAIDEIINSLKNFQTAPFKDKPQHIEPLEEVRTEEKKEIQEKPAKTTKRKLLSGVTLLSVLIVTSILTYPKIFKRDTLEKLRSSGERISVAVMPFQNMTNDTTLNVWQDGIQINLVTSLSNSGELKVRQLESVNKLIQSKGLDNYMSITPSVASMLSRKLEASILIRGSINLDGRKLRINSQLIDSESEDVLQSFKLEGTSDNILPVIDSLAQKIEDYLIISKLKNSLSLDFQQPATTDSPEALENFIHGNNSFMKMDFGPAANWYLQSLKCDSDFINAAIWLSIAYVNQGLYEESKKLCTKIYQKRDQMPNYLKLWTIGIYTIFNENLSEHIKSMNQLLEIDDQQPIVYYELGNTYNRIDKYDKAIPAFEKALEIYDKWGIKPMWVPNYTQLGYAYHKSNRYKEEKVIYKKAERDFPDNLTEIIYRQSVLALTEQDTSEANIYLKKYRSLLKENNASNATIENSIGNLYSEAGILEKAEGFYRQAVLSSPKNPYWKYSLAYFLIDKDLNIKQGLELIDKELDSDRENYNYLHIKGWALYKQGKYQEALEILQNSWDLRMKKAMYNHSAYLHLQAAKKDVAGMK